MSQDGTGPELELYDYSQPFVELRAVISKMADSDELGLKLARKARDVDTSYSDLYDQAIKVVALNKTYMDTINRELLYTNLHIFATLQYPALPTNYQSEVSKLTSICDSVSE
jgi:hypothetical protein